MEIPYMIKKNVFKIVCIVALLVSQNLFANECVDANGNDISAQPEIFTELIKNEKSCYNASTMAEACAWGSSLDVMTAGAAYEVCETELQQQNPNPELLILMSLMQKACTQKYENQEGTMYRSINAYCHLSAIKWIVNIAIEK